jgi:pimeloyl-ACP methyl ester carboxylesterase
MLKKIFVLGTIMAVTALAKINFSELVMDYSGIPPLQQYSARDGEHLDYRYYPSKAKTLVILLHGSAWHSRYFYNLAKNLSSQDVAQFITPDLRGHGEHPKKRGDIDYIGQYDDDLVDLINFVKKTYAPQKIVLGGHSSGGGLALRFAGGVHQELVDGVVLLAPFLKYDAPTVRQDSGWAEGKILKTIGLSILNAMGIHAFDHSVTLTFNLPTQFRDGTETLEYSHATVVSFSPVDYEKDLKSLQKPTLVLVGEDDEAMVASAFAQVIPKSSLFDLQILPHVTHMGVVVDPAANLKIKNWIVTKVSR